MKTLVVLVCCLLLRPRLAQAFHFDPRYDDWNLNKNQYAGAPEEYWGEWVGHAYHPSPDNWRFPFYTIMLDRWVNGDPHNDNINGTAFERDSRSTQLRYGGDVNGLIDSLDYIQGMGIRGLYLAGSFFINLPWTYDQYSPLDLTLLDQHLGTLQQWQSLVDEAHARGLYIILDNTFATLSDLIGFKGHLNESVPFNAHEYSVLYKTTRQYNDFSFGSNTYNNTCNFPRFYNETGFRVESSIDAQFKGCYDSDFDQFGDTEAFGVYPDWRRQVTKFASVQDRLREWHPPVRNKLQLFYCSAIAQLDIDGFRYDKATQSTVDALGEMNDYIRKCATRYGKENFFIPGEITGGNNFGSIYLGRGRQPNMLPASVDDAYSTTDDSDAHDKYSIRASGHQALDSAAFHYTVYRALVRFLGMDGNLEAADDAPVNFVDMWNVFMVTNDFINPSTGEFDPRHMYGVTNQDVFRWPAVSNGTQRQLLGHFVTNLLLPGAPLILWGEEQTYYILDNLAPNYVFGRQPMASNVGWQDHGCYSQESLQFYRWPLDKARYGCYDETVGWDHRDPAAPVRNALKHMFYLRDQYPVINDGFFLKQLSNQTVPVQYPGSSGKVTETGIWSVTRAGLADHQEKLADMPPVWMIYSNLNDSKVYEFDCSDDDTTLQTRAFLAPFEGGTTIRNLLPPFDTIKLSESSARLGLNGSSKNNGCVDQLAMAAYEFRAYVLSSNWTGPSPSITRFFPGHDARILASSSDASQLEVINVTIEFSVPMDCNSITQGISFESSAHMGITPRVSPGSVSCGLIPDPIAEPNYTSIIPSVYQWNGKIENLQHGIHALIVSNASANASAIDQNASTGVKDRFLLRIGKADNPMVFPRTANYSNSLVTQKGKDEIQINHSAPGAELWRYSTNWGSSFSEWAPYLGGSDRVNILPWHGTSKQAWKGQHVRVEYWNHLVGSADHIVEGDTGHGVAHQHRYPHLSLQGPFNQYGYDSGPKNEMDLVGPGTWLFYFVTEWPAIFQLNVWGIDPDKQPDKTYVLGDYDQDSVLDRQTPGALSAAVINITGPPPVTSVGWKLGVDDGTGRFHLTPSGYASWQLAIFVLLWTLPIILGVASVAIFRRSFYGVKAEKFGLVKRASRFPFLRNLIKHRTQPSNSSVDDNVRPVRPFVSSMGNPRSSTIWTAGGNIAQTRTVAAPPRRTVLIATMEYDIEDWEIKIKIGGLGVMAQLMGKNLSHQDLVWVVPCVGGVDYPQDEVADPMNVKILGKAYKVGIQYHKFKNITYVLLDAPVFRSQTKSDPYPSRMDDMSSAVYYSAWNQCIAQTIERFPVDIYHINDYHGCVAPLYLLPSTIPVCLSLHNAEFQGLWPMRTYQECDEVSRVFNIPSVFVQRFIQYGEVFNLLHAGASYLRVYQRGFGAVGVSKKYGVRSYLRYPIFWGLKKVGQLPNPDPTDTGEWDKKLPREDDIIVDPEFESRRPGLKKEAQEWAGLNVDPEADLFVFVGRWSTQKGVDLIADIFPSILETYPKVQLVCVGPVIDLYGRFAAVKLEQMMKLYPGRVLSKPVFTALPPCIFSGADFALIPSRDEPFGLVAVEFGRKGAIGVGARVGGLGQMPGWWYTVESMQTAHLIEQFKLAVSEAINSKPAERAMLRARSAKQRFPVKQWVEDLEILQSTAIRLHEKSPQDIESRAYSTAKKTVSRPANKLRRRQRYTYNSNNYPPWDDFDLLEEAGPEHADPFPSETASEVDASEFEPRMEDFHLDESDDNDSRSGDTTPTAATTPIHHTVPNISITPSSDVATLFQQVDHTSSAERSQFAADLSLRLQTEPDELQEASSEDPSSQELSDSHSSGVSTPGAPILSQARAVSMIRASRIGTDLDAKKYNSLSPEAVVGPRKDFKLQKVEPFFTDQTGEYMKAFQSRLQGLKGSNSESKLCIEQYLMKSEKRFFGNYRDLKLGISTVSEKRVSSSTKHVSGSTITSWSHRSALTPSNAGSELAAAEEEKLNDLSAQLGLDPNQAMPRGPAKWLQIRIGDWPVYAFLLAVGQIIAANSYQIVLLTGQVGQNASEVYVISCTYLVSSALWWLLFRQIGSRACLSLPFFFYGLAFLFVGLSRFAATGTPRSYVNHVSSASYAIASASGTFFFVLNFGDEGGSQVKAWVFRACVIQGLQQVYVTILWFWGYHVNRTSAEGLPSPARKFSNSPYMTLIGIVLAFLCWCLGLLLWTSLPKYYRQVPGIVPDFYRSIFRRNIVNWFFVAVLIQNFFLSTQYGRSWSFLFTSAHVAWWQVFLLVLLFFVALWIALTIGLFSRLTRTHTWILPIFGVGLGAPRWAQVWWGVSNMGLWLPWCPGGYVGSALLARCLWLWLGLLDMLQGVGVGMMLLSTLTRMHVLFALVVAQMLGAAMTAVARASSPARLGPGPVFPDLTEEGAPGLQNAWFWIGLLLNLAVCGGYYRWFRREQLTKP